MEYARGAGLAALVNALNMVAWFFFGPWVPSAVMAFLALAITALYGFDERWRLVFGYWLVQVLVFMVWLFGLAGAGSAFLTL